MNLKFIPAKNLSYEEDSEYRDRDFEVDSLEALQDFVKNNGPVVFDDGKISVFNDFFKRVYLQKRENLEEEE